MDMRPTGPNGTWRCEEEACGFIVRRADEELGRGLIREHFREHEEELRRLRLAETEGAKNRQQVTHLLEKIKAAGRKAVEAEQRYLNGTPLPLPIKRRLLY